MLVPLPHSLHGDLEMFLVPDPPLHRLQSPALAAISSKLMSIPFPRPSVQTQTGRAQGLTVSAIPHPHCLHWKSPPKVNPVCGAGAGEPVPMGTVVPMCQDRSRFPPLNNRRNSDPSDRPEMQFNSPRWASGAVKKKKKAILLQA